ncbi:TIGR02757 family protein [Lewinellaceae bacterium SD302]|nr:TIGR02757 family protein [Lewinellaceae bacterium SD302]
MISVTKAQLDALADRYNRPAFIPHDPISLPHAFEDRRDREIIGFWTAVLAWGQRKTILNKSLELVELMGGEPYRFITEHHPEDRDRFADWKHRTFNFEDTRYFLEWLQRYYREHDSLEEAFARHLTPEDEDIENALRGFHDDFFSLPDAPRRTRKHIATPTRKSRCKRLCMFLRWMVRRDENGVDFGDWSNISPAQLCLPLDVHVERVARQFGLLTRKQCDWLAVKELTANLRSFDAEDPARYDFALFGLGVMKGEGLAGE